MALTLLMLENAETDVDTLAAVVNGGPTDPDVVNRAGTHIKTLARVISEATTGYEPPVAYAAGIHIDRASQTVTEAGQTYAPDPGIVPFITPGVFDPAQWRLLIGKPVGLLKDAHLSAVPVGIDLVQTSGNEVAGQGAAQYFRDGTVDLVAYPKAGFTDSAAQKFRIVSEQPLNSQQFYDATDSSYGQCIQRGLDYLHAIGINGGGPDAYRGSAPFRVPAGDYSSNIPIDIYHSLEVFGDGSGDGGPAPASGVTHIHFLGTSGFRMQHPTTFGDSGVDALGSHPGVGRAKLRGFMLTSNTGYDNSKHAIILRGQGDVEDIYARDWGGLALRGWTGNFRGVAYAGNISGARLIRIKGENCQGTASIGGTDSNVIQSDGLNGYQNRQFGIEDANAAGSNMHRGMHNAFNGLVPPAAGPFCACSQSGNIYTPNIQAIDFTNLAGLSAFLNAHAPSGTTDHNGYWLYAGPGGPTAQTPAYPSGGPWIYGGDMLSLTPAGEWFSCYMEGGGLLSQSVYKNPTWTGGTIDRTQLFGGTLLQSTDAGYEITRSGGNSFILRSRGGSSFFMLDFDNFEWFSIEQTIGGPTYFHTPSSGKFRVTSGGVQIDIANWAANGLNLEPGKVLNIGGVDVLSGQMAAIADLGAAPSAADFNGLLAKMRGIKILHA